MARQGRGKKSGRVEMALHDHSTVLPSLTFVIPCQQLTGKQRDRAGLWSLSKVLAENEAPEGLAAIPPQNLFICRLARLL